MTLSKMWRFICQFQKTAENKVDVEYITLLNGTVKESVKDTGSYLKM